MLRLGRPRANWYEESILSGYILETIWPTRCPHGHATRRPTQTVYDKAITRGMPSEAEYLGQSNSQRAPFWKHMRNFETRSCETYLLNQMSYQKNSTLDCRHEKICFTALEINHKIIWAIIAYFVVWSYETKYSSAISPLPRQIVSVVTSFWWWYGVLLAT